MTGTKTGVRVDFSDTRTRHSPTTGDAPYGKLQPHHRKDAIMPRQPRIELLGIPQHIVQRGNDRQPCFFTDVDNRNRGQSTFLDDTAVREEPL